jgi:hypothetical protein
VGCDIHAILQRKDKDGVWNTVLTNVIPNRDYQLFSILSGVRGDSDLGPIASRLDPFNDTSFVGYNTGHLNSIIYNDELYCMGEHSFGYITMEELGSHVKEIPQLVDNPKTYKEAANNFVAQMERLRNEELELYEDSDQKRINDLYQAFQILLGYDIDNYRLVFGYDS